MNRIKKPKTDFYTFNNLSNYPEIKHFISTNIKRRNNEIKHELDISFNTGKSRSLIIENRQILSNTVDIPLENFVMQNQMHTSNISIINESHKGLGIFDHNNTIPNNDAMITNKKGLCLFVFAADCAPILFYDPIKKVIAAAHSGWQGTVKKIAQKTALKMIEIYGSSINNIHVAVAPSIHLKNYEIGDNVVEAVLKSFGTKAGYLKLNSATKKYHFDINFAIKKQLIDIGLDSENIQISKYCTLDRQDIFFSARGKKNTGRFGAGIMLV